MASRVQGLDGSYQYNGHGATKSGLCKYSAFVICVHIIFLIHLTKTRIVDAKPSCKHHRH